MTESNYLDNRHERNLMSIEDFTNEISSFFIYTCNLPLSIISARHSLYIAEAAILLNKLLGDRISINSWLNTYNKNLRSKPVEFFYTEKKSKRALIYLRSHIEI